MTGILPRYMPPNLTPATASSEPKNNENRVFAPNPPRQLSRTSRYFNSLRDKFVTRRNNEFFPPINELKRPYQRTSNEKSATCENGEKCARFRGGDGIGRSGDA
jgi:hypothetical protein